MPPCTCPVCGGALEHDVSDDFKTWTCPAGHGAGMTVTEATHHFEPTALHRIWAAASSAGAGMLRCPFCARPMADLTVELGGPARAVIKVCRADDLIWFAAEDYAELPAKVDAVEAPASAEATLAAVRRDAGRAVDRGARQADDRVIRWVADHPVLGALLLNPVLVAKMAPIRTTETVWPVRLPGDPWRPEGER